MRIDYGKNGPYMINLRDRIWGGEDVLKMNLFAYCLGKRNHGKARNIWISLSSKPPDRADFSWEIKYEFKVDKEPFPN